MLPRFLLAECIARGDGAGPRIEVAAHSGKLIVLTLGINQVVEQERLMITVRGSSDGVVWGPKPLALFPPKSYCGIYSTLLNLAKYPDVKFIRVEWKMNRSGAGDHTPLFEFYVFAEASGSRVRATVA